MKALGADEVIDRGTDVVARIGAGQLDLVVDVVGGESWSRLLGVLRPGGRYVCAGAIAGPVGALDLRTLYLRDLALIGCTYQGEGVIESLVSYIERGEVRPGGGEDVSACGHRDRAGRLPCQEIHRQARAGATVEDPGRTPSAGAASRATSGRRHCAAREAAICRRPGAPGPPHRAVAVTPRSHRGLRAPTSPGEHTPVRRGYGGPGPAPCSRILSLHAARSNHAVDFRRRFW